MTCHMILRRFCMINRKIVVFFSIQVDESIDLANKFQVAFVRFINEVEIEENKGIDTFTPECLKDCENLN